MGFTDWMEIYRSYDDAALTVEMGSLQKSLAGGFTSQGSGSVQHTRDVTELRDRLKAATRVIGERGSTAPQRTAVVDFSGMQTHDF